MSRLSHSFSVEHAELYGVECAILIAHFQFWIEQNQNVGRNFHDGRTWMYQTQKEIAAVYPYMNEDGVARIIKKLIDFKVLVKGNYNKTPFDKTAWYSFENEEKFTKPQNRGIDVAESQNLNPQNSGMETEIERNGSRETAEPIPDTNKHPNPISKQQQTGDMSVGKKTSLSVPVCPLDKSVSLFLPNDGPPNDNKVDAVNWFLKIGCDILSATQFVEKFSSEDIHNASGYVQKQLEIKKSKGEKIQNIVGYMRRTLEGRYWEQRR